MCSVQFTKTRSNKQKIANNVIFPFHSFVSIMYYDKTIERGRGGGSQGFGIAKIFAGEKNHKFQSK